MWLLNTHKGPKIQNSRIGGSGYHIWYSQNRSGVDNRGVQETHWGRQSYWGSTIVLGWRKRTPRNYPYSMWFYLLFLKPHQFLKRFGFEAENGQSTPESLKTQGFWLSPSYCALDIIGSFFWCETKNKESGDAKPSLQMRREFVRISQ